MVSSQPMPPRAATRCGRAEPRVRAPTNTPRARPRRRRNHVDAAFSPGGYTRASPAPVTARPTIAEGRSGATNRVRLATAATVEPISTRRRGGIRSARFATADPTAPTTKPIWTAIVSHDPSVRLRSNSARSSLSTAAAANQVDMARTMAVARNAN